MKLHAEQNTVIKSGDTQDSNFSIEASAKAFFILSDGLYSNKVKAVIRELSTNAYDSHVEAGVVDKPFDVNLPTRLDPTFYVRDYGTSMTHDECMTLYTTYFRSTRNDSNDAVGCLGLGSKAPFAYCDQFTVEAYLDGTLRVYTAYKDQSGSPVFSLLDERETNEPNGVKVSMAVNEDDTYNFLSEARELYKFFNVKPNISGVDNDDIYFGDDKEVILFGSNWEFVKGDHQNYVIMGQIAYPLNSDDVWNWPVAKEDEAAYNFLDRSRGLRIYANIGDVDITPSRESLSYNSATKQALKNIISEMSLELAIDMERQIEEQPSLYLARRQYLNLCNQCQSLRSVMESLDNSISYNGETLWENGMEQIEVGELISVKHYYKSQWRQKIETDQATKINLRHDTRIIIDDLPRGGLSRIREYIKEQGEFSGYMFHAGDLEDNPNAANAFLELLGGAEVEDCILTSTLPKPVRNYSYSGGGASVQGQVYDHEAGHFVECKISVKEEDAYYIEESRGEVYLRFEDYYRSIQLSTLQARLRTIAQHADSISDYKIFLVKPSVAKNKKLNERDGWHNGSKLIVRYINEIMTEKRDLLTKYRNSPKISEKAGTSNLGEAIKMTTSNNDLKKIFGEWEEYCAEVEGNEDELRQIFKLEYWSTTEQIKYEDNTYFSDRFDESVKKYPMLRHVDCRYRHLEETEAQEIAEYIDLVQNSVDK